MTQTKKETGDVCSRRRSSKVKKGALSESFFALMRCSTCKSMFPWENLTLRVDKRSLCRNYIFRDECKHRSECARSKERCLCAVTLLLGTLLLRLVSISPCGETQILKYFLRVLETLPAYKHDVTVFARLCKRKFAPPSYSPQITLDCNSVKSLISIIIITDLITLRWYVGGEKYLKNIFSFCLITLN